MRAIVFFMFFFVTSSVWSAQVDVSELKIVGLNYNKAAGVFNVFFDKPQSQCIFGAASVTDPANALSTPMISLAMQAYATGTSVSITYHTNTPSQYVCDLTALQITQ